MMNILLFYEHFFLFFYINFVCRIILIFAEFLTILHEPKNTNAMYKYFFDIHNKMFSLHFDCVDSTSFLITKCSMNIRPTTK